MEIAVDIQTILSAASDLSVIGLLLVILVGGARGWFVYGWIYRQALRERDDWKSLALKGTALAKKAVSFAESGHNGDS